MASEKYYLIDSSADGRYLREYNADEVQEFLDEINEYGEEHLEEQPFHSKVEDHWGRSGSVDLDEHAGYFLIKGRLIIPVEKEIVTKLVVE